MTTSPSPTSPNAALVSKPEAPGRGADLPLPSASLARDGPPTPCPDRDTTPPTLKRPAHSASVLHDEVPCITPEGVPTFQPLSAFVEHMEDY